MKTITTVVLCLLLAGCVMAVDESLPYAALPSITVATEVKLVASPAHPTAYLSSVSIAAGEKMQVIGTDKDSAWLLVLHKDQLGWMPSIFSRDNVGTLKAAIVVEPLADNCTEYLDAVVAPDEAWESNTAGAVIVVGSIYRPQTGKQFDAAALAIQIDGSGTVIDADYMHTPLTPSSAVILFAYSIANLQKGDQISFAVSNPSNEPLSFQAAFFSNDCPQDLVRLPIGKTRVVVAKRVATPTGNVPVPTQQAPTFTPTPVIIKPDPQQTTACIRPPDGLVSWWPGDGNADDIVGMNNGKLVNGATLASGKVEQAFSLDGVNDTIDLGTNNIIGSGHMPFSVTFWMHSTRIPTGWYYMPIKLKQDTQFFIAFSKDFYASGDYIFTTFRGATQWLTGVNHSSILNQWTHVAIIYNGGNKSNASSFVVFLNGVQLSTATANLGAAGGSCNNNTIGSDGDSLCGGNSAFFQGLIDEVQVYNRPLDSKEIQAIYNADSVGMCKPGTATKNAAQTVQTTNKSTATAIPTATPMTDTPRGTILGVGQIWRQGGAEIIVKNVELTTNEIHFDLAFTNQKPQDIFVRYSLDSYTVIDNLGRRSRVPGSEIGYNCGGFSWNVENTIPVPRGKTVNLSPCKNIYALVDVGNPNVTEIIITISGVSSINEARWRIPIYH